MWCDRKKIEQKNRPFSTSGSAFLDDREINAAQLFLRQFTGAKLNETLTPQSAPSVE